MVDRAVRPARELQQGVGSDRVRRACAGCVRGHPRTFDVDFDLPSKRTPFRGRHHARTRWFSRRAPNSSQDRDWRRPGPMSRLPRDFSGRGACCPAATPDAPRRRSAVVLGASTPSTRAAAGHTSRVSRAARWATPRDLSTLRWRECTQHCGDADRSPDRPSLRSYLALLLILGFLWIPSCFLVADALIGVWRFGNGKPRRAVPDTPRLSLQFVTMTTVGIVFVLTRYATFAQRTLPATRVSSFMLVMFGEALLRLTVPLMSGG